MKTKIMHLAGTAALALLLSACGGGGSGGATGSSGAGSTQANSMPAQMQAVVDQSNNFTDALCPQTTNGTATGTNIDPNACISEALSKGPSSLTDVVASFCPNAAAAVNSGTFDPTQFLQSFSNPQGFVTSGSLTFPVACLEEAATNLNNIQSLVGTNNPITQQLCPNAAQASTFDPATCFAEITSGSSGSLPGLPGLPGTGGSGGSLGGTQFLNNFCPQAASQSMGPQMAVNCLNESSRVYIKVMDMLTASNPLYDNLCPKQAATGRVEDPIGCFKEALSGGLPGLPGTGGGSGVPGIGQLLNAICPNAAAAGISQNTPIACLTEAGQNLGGLQNLLGGLGGSNPLTQALCPNAAAASSFSPSACFQEALGQLPSGGGSSIPGLGMVVDQLCPNAAAGGFDPTVTPTACLMELGSNFGNLQNLLGGLGGANPITQQLCPNTAASGSFDPAACFTEALQHLPGAGGGNLPGFGSVPLIGQLCPNTASGSVGLTTPVNCLQEAGGNLGQLQNLLGNVGGANPLTDALCPNASAASSFDPQACLTEALGKLPGASGGSGAGLPGFGSLPVISQLCPNTAGSGNIGPTTPINCLQEAGGNLGQLQNVLGGLTGANPITQQFCPNASAASSFNPQACLTEALGNLPGAGGGQLPTQLPSQLTGLLANLCPNTAAAGLSPTSVVSCLAEAGGNLGQLQSLLGGGLPGGSSALTNNPLTQQLCPNAVASGSFSPQSCLTEALGNLPGAGGVGGASNPLTQALCPNTAAGSLSPTTPIDCLVEAGGKLGQLQSLLGGLPGGTSALTNNPLTDALCPNAAASGSFSPQACLTEALSTLPGLGSATSASNPLTDALCPNTAAGGLSPTTPISCLTEAGGNLGQFQNLLGGLSNVANNPITQVLCPTTAASGSFDPQGCLTEAVGTLSGGTGGLSQLGQLQGLLGGLSGGAGNPLTNALCPTAATATPFNPVTCFNETLSSVTSSGSNLPVLGTVLNTVGGLLSGLLTSLGGVLSGLGL